MEENPQDECPNFCGEFLSDLPQEQQGKIVHLLHGVVQRKYSDYFSMCNGLLKEIEDSVGIESAHYGMLLKAICLALLKVSEPEAAIQLVQQRLDTLNKEDFATIMILGVIYDKKSEYENAFATYQRANDAANQKDDNLRGALSLVKMATSSWNLEQPELSLQFRDKGERTFKQVMLAEDNANASTEELFLLIDFYKTLGYLSKKTLDHSHSKNCYLKALDIIKKHNYSLVQELKVLSLLSGAYAQLGDELAVDRHNQRALQIMEDILKNSTYIASHAGQLIHIMSRLRFSYQFVKNLEASFQVGEKALNIARKFLGDEHLEVARLAADTAVLCQRLNWHRRVVEFVEIYEKSLKDSDYKNDEEKVKLFVRELTDSLSHYAFCCSLQSNYAAAEENYKEAIEINKKVYGETSLRVANQMKFLARIYNKWGKYELAKEYFQKCVSSVEKFQPNNTRYINDLKKEMANCGPRIRRVYKKGF